MGRKSALIGACLSISICAGASLPRSDSPSSWNAPHAAAYLDKRAEWWMAWPAAARDHGTFCVSCHTAMPYALSRPALRAMLHEEAPTASERKLLDNVIRRVRLWNEVKPFYEGGKYNSKAAESLGTEAILNALILASYDSQSGKLDGDARLALHDMWSMQHIDGESKGAWSWLQFDNEPFEGHDSQYYGAALAAVTVGMASDAYLSEPDIQNNLKMLRDYLNREYDRQSPINRVVLLWASIKWPGLVAPERQREVIRDVEKMQQPDGGWNLGSLSWTWRDWDPHSLAKMLLHSYGTPLKGISDGYATGLIAFVLEQARVPLNDQHLSNALAWLLTNQKADGRWLSYSLNNQRDPSSGTGLFMSDAATAYAVLALTHAN